AARGLDVLLHVLRIVALTGEEGDGHVRALARVGDRHRGADAAVASGDQGELAFELAAADVTVLAMVRARFHARGLAGEGLLLALERRLRVIGQGHGGAPWSGGTASVCGDR